MTVLISSIGDTFQGKCGAGIHVASFIKGVIGISDLSNGVKQYRMIGNVIPETVYLGPCIILQTGCAAGGIGCIIDGIIKGEGRKVKCTIAQQLSISLIRMVRKQVLYAVNRSNAGYGTSILIIINFSTIDRTPCVYFETAVAVYKIWYSIEKYGGICLIHAAGFGKQIPFIVNLSFGVFQEFVISDIIPGTISVHPFHTRKKFLYFSRREGDVIMSVCIEDAGLSKKAFFIIIFFTIDSLNASVSNSLAVEVV